MDGRHFIVEMQCASDTWFVQRAVEYASQVYLNQRTIEKKIKNDTGRYKRLRSVIFLAIMEKTLFPQKQAFLSHHQFRDIVTGEQDIKEMSFSFLELSRFHKHFEELKDDIDQWVYYFKKAKHINPEKLNKILSKGTIFGEAYKVLKKSAYTESQLLEYTRYELKEEIETRISDAKIEGEKIGIEKGKAEGEKNAKIESAKNALALGLSTEQVSKISGLSIKEIPKLV